MQHPFTRAASLRVALPAALLLAANAWVCHRLFFAEYLDQMWSADGAFIAFARYAMDHWREMSWFPLWFCGMPYQDVYGPLLHHLVALHAAAWHVSPAAAYHFSSALLYSLGPVTLFGLAWRLSGSRNQGFLAALIYTAFSPTALLIPQIRADLGGWFYLRRLHNLVIWGEAPHIAALVWIPLVLLCLEGRRRVWLLPAAVLMAMVALTNVTGTVGLGMAVIAWIVAKPVPEYRAALARTAAAALLGYGLAMPWLPPSTVARIVANSQASAGRLFPFTGRHVLYFAALGLLVALARWAAARLPLLARFGLLLALISGVITMLGFWSDISIVPQPTRFQLEFEMGVALLLGALVRSRLAVALPCAALLFWNHSHADEYIRPIEIRETIEYREAQWFDRHMGGARVFAPGSVSLWMNLFTDTPQFAGCCDQGVPDWEQRVALHTIYRAPEGEASVLWLQAYGVAAIGVSAPGSTEAYKPFDAPRKFEGLLPVLWREGPDTIYGVPRRSSSLAHVIGEGDVVTRRPVNGLDTAQLRRFVAALNDPSIPAAGMRWDGPAHARIQANLAPGQLISVQVAWHPGWRARVAGEARPVERDALGLILIRPQCTGPCAVEFVFDGGIEKPIARVVCALSLVACLLLLVRWYRRA